MNTDRDLITFINQEKKIEKISNRQILVYFNKCFKKSIKELDSKFINIKNKQNNVLAGLNMLYHIFVVLLCYSNNLKLTVFLIDRAILLFTEFIIMSQDKKIIEDICFIPDITDAISFCYKKTIGSIKIESIYNNNIDPFVEEFIKLNLNIYQNLYIYCVSNNNLEHLDLPDKQLTELFLIFFSKRRKYCRFMVDYTNTILVGLSEKTILDKIVIIRIVLEMMALFLKHHCDNNLINMIDFFQKNFYIICESSLVFNKNKEIQSYDLYKQFDNKILDFFNL